MISRSTVLVLGAGASVPYGYPTGRGLLLDVREKLLNPPSMLQGILLKRGIPLGHPGALAMLLSQSMQPSVDAFLENRPEFMQIGKIAIALSLIPLERQEKIEERGQTMEWYEYLFHQLGPRQEDIEQSRLTVVTFNYDRSFEYFLYNALVRSFDLTAEQALALYHRVPVIHVYGDLGMPNFIESQGRPYNPSLDPASIMSAADSIQIPSPGSPIEAPFLAAMDAICKAEIVCFLGFAYHPANVRRLGIPPSPGPILTGSAYHLPANEVGAVHRQFPYQISLGEFDQACLSFLQNNPVFE